MKDLPNGWDFVQFSEIAEIFNGKTPSKAEQRNVGWPVLKIKDINKAGEFIGNFDSYVDDEFYEKYINKKIIKGDSLILNAAHSSDHVASKIYYASNNVENSIATGEWLIIRVKDNYVNPKFINYLIQNPEQNIKIKYLVKGIHLYPKDIQRLTIPLPFKNGKPDLNIPPHKWGGVYV